MYLAAEGQPYCPVRELQQDRKKVGVGERGGRDLNSHLVVTMENNGDAARFKPVDRSRKKIPCGSFHDVFDEGAEPSAAWLPLPARIVHERDIRWRVLELGRN